MASKILKRIQRQAAGGDIVEMLAKMPASDLQSLLLEVYRRQVQRITPDRLLRHYRESRFVGPSAVPGDRFLKLELLASSLLPAGFQMLELSPLTPLGSCAAVAAVDQNNIVSTVRGAEVVADATNVLALEAALRRGKLLSADSRSRQRVELCAGNRHVRGQSFSDAKFSAHFKVFCLVSAGRDEGNLAFEMAGLERHLDFYIRLLQAALHHSRQKMRLEAFVSDFSGRHAADLRERLLPPLAAKFPDVAFALDPDRQGARGYYDPFCFNIRLAGDSGTSFAYLVDGGCTAWTQKLLGNRKERLLTSGIGTELLLKTIDVDLG